MIQRKIKDINPRLPHVAVMPKNAVTLSNVDVLGLERRHRDLSTNYVSIRRIEDTKTVDSVQS